MAVQPGFSVATAVEKTAGTSKASNKAGNKDSNMAGFPPDGSGGVWAVSVTLKNAPAGRNGLRPLA